MKRRLWRGLFGGILLITLLGVSGIGWWLWTDYQKRLNFKPEGQIVYECWPERRNSKICLINADRKGYKQLTDEPSRSPTWLPDGKHIAFMGSKLTVIDVDNSAVKSLDFDKGGQFVWSPNGQQIVFVRSGSKLRPYTERDEIAGLYIINADGSNEIRLTNFTTYNPSWSPDAKHVAFISYLDEEGREPRVFIISPDGAEVKQITNTYSRTASWSPDSKQLVFTCITEKSRGGICVINVDGSGLIQLTYSHEQSPTWSPDGKYIAYWGSDPLCFLCNLSGQLWIMKADGSYQQRLTNGPVDMNPAWRPTK